MVCIGFRWLHLGAHSSHDVTRSLVIPDFIIFFSKQLQQMEEPLQNQSWNFKVHLDWPGLGYSLTSEPMIIILIVQAEVWNQEVGSALDTVQTASKERATLRRNLRACERDKKILILESQNKSYPLCRRSWRMEALKRNLSQCGLEACFVWEGELKGWFL